MQRVLLLCMLLLAGLAAPSPAFSKGVSLSATVAQVRLACSKVGGVFSVHQDGGGYGCDKKNCDGKGGHCSVHCTNNNSCTGESPTRVAPDQSNGVMGVLSGRNGLTTMGQDGEDSSKPDRPKPPEKEPYTG